MVTLKVWIAIIKNGKIYVSTGFSKTSSTYGVFTLQQRKSNYLQWFNRNLNVRDASRNIRLQAEKLNYK